MPFDAIILGLGAMGSAAAHHLAQRGKRVLGIEQFTSPHDQGSSHGGSRMIRQAYWESPDYIPLVLRAYESWRKLEREANTQLLHITGGMNIGSRDGDLVTRTIAAAEKHSIPFDVLGPREISRRFPVLVPQPDDVKTVAPFVGSPISVSVAGGFGVPVAGEVVVVVVVDPDLLTCVPSVNTVRLSPSASPE